MIDRDIEIAALKASVSCAVLLERLPPPWRLDRAESSRRNLKYRRGEGEIVIVNHDGRGWWDPLSNRKGDIFTLMQHLDPGLSFVEARRMLLGFVGVPPVFPKILSARPPWASHIPITEQWNSRRPLSPGSRAWRYLAQQRRLPEAILVTARAADAVREGPQGSAWFAHRDGLECLTGIEMRGPAWRSFSTGGEKTLFRLSGGPGLLPRVAVCEGAIDAMSLAAIEHERRDTDHGKDSFHEFTQEPPRRFVPEAMRGGDTRTLIAQQLCGTVPGRRTAPSHPAPQSCRKGWFVGQLRCTPETAAALGSHSYKQPPVTATPV